jgi:hypothetical protein
VCEADPQVPPQQCATRQVALDLGEVVFRRQEGIGPLYPSEARQLSRATRLVTLPSVGRRHCVGCQERSLSLPFLSQHAFMGTHDCLCGRQETAELRKSFEFENVIIIAEAFNANKQTGQAREFVHFEHQYFADEATLHYSTPARDTGAAEQRERVVLVVPQRKIESILQQVFVAANS